MVSLKNIGRTLGWVIVVIVSFLILFPLLTSHRFLFYPLFHNEPGKYLFYLSFGILVDIPLFLVYMKCVFSDPGGVPSGWVIHFFFI